MPWNWELPNWPQFSFDFDQISKQERQFLLSAGKACAFLKNIDEQDYKQFIVEILSQEGVESSKIEGEFLDRESLQSSIKQHFGLKQARQSNLKNERGMADLLCDVYDSFETALSHEMLWDWHQKLFEYQLHIEDLGKYRTHEEPMQIVSNRYDSRKVYFEAPPSHRIFEEMEHFLRWFNGEQPSESILARAALAHVYFESIHPFEDGNGRIGRLLVEKVLSQGLGRSILITVSKVLEKRKKEYYVALGKCNRSLAVNEWVEFFADVILQAQKESIALLYFLIEKSRMMTRLSGQLNSRQEKVLLRIFNEGPQGFKGGLSAENYISITKTSRATATRDLSDLVEKKALIKSGELRHTRYCINILSVDS